MATRSPSHCPELAKAATRGGLRAFQCTCHHVTAFSWRAWRDLCHWRTRSEVTLKNSYFSNSCRYTVQAHYREVPCALCLVPPLVVDCDIKTRKWTPGPQPLSDFTRFACTRVCVFLCSLITGVGFCNHHHSQDTEISCHCTLPLCHPLRRFTH